MPKSLAHYYEWEESGGGLEEVLEGGVEGEDEPPYEDDSDDGDENRSTGMASDASSNWAKLERRTCSKARRSSWFLLCRVSTPTFNETPELTSVPPLTVSSSTKYPPSPSNHAFSLPNLQVAHPRRLSACFDFVKTATFHRG